MPPTADSQVPAKRSKAKQDPNIAQRLENGPFIKALKHVEAAFWETEKAREKGQSEKYKDQNTKAEIKDLKVQLTQATDELNAEKAGKIRLLRLNDELKIKLLNVQPQSQLTDSHIAGQYTLLRQNVSSWLDSEVRRFEVHWKSQHSGNSPQFDVLRVGSFSGHTGFIKDGYRYGSHYLLESYILHQLHRLLFGVGQKFFAFGQHERALIESCEEGLSQLSPPRGKFASSPNDDESTKVVIIDHAAIRYLRSELLKGFVKSHGFQLRQTEWMNNDGMDLLKRTSTMLPETSHGYEQIRLKTFRKDVLGPALEFAIAMQTSATAYGFSEPTTDETRFKSSPLRYTSSNNCRIINIDTRLEMKVDQPANKRRDDVFAQRVLLICPGLFRHDGDEEAKWLTDDIICAKFPPNANKVSPVVVQDQHQAVTDSGGSQLSTPKKKRKRTKSCSSPIDVESSTDLDELVKTKKEETSSADEI
ncbi:MAG: hypothetical protein LQ337_008717 [Flavoplaca oasis]|nr:MAG: hypothetical protein LQ337_008717 [Flavoplaca oasis]